VRIGRVFTPEEGVGAAQFACEAAAGATLTRTPAFGGAYQIDDCGSATRSNPLTGALGCPSGFVAAKYGRAKNPEAGQCGVTQFFCWHD
jgi:hypothetical protein